MKNKTDFGKILIYILITLIVLFVLGLVGKMDAQDQQAYQKVWDERNVQDGINYQSKASWWR